MMVGKGDSFKIWPCLVSMVDFCGVYPLKKAQPKSFPPPSNLWNFSILAGRWWKWDVKKRRKPSSLIEMLFRLAMETCWKWICISENEHAQQWCGFLFRKCISIQFSGIYIVKGVRLYSHPVTVPLGFWGFSFTAVISSFQLGRFKAPTPTSARKMLLSCTGPSTAGWGCRGF